MRDDWSSLAQIKYIPSSVMWNFSAIFNPPPANNCERAFTQSYFLCGKLAIKGNQVWSCIDETRRAISIHTQTFCTIFCKGPSSALSATLMVLLHVLFYFAEPVFSISFWHSKAGLQFRLTFSNLSDKI